MTICKPGARFIFKTTPPIANGAEYSVVLEKHYAGAKIVASWGSQELESVAGVAAELTIDAIGDTYAVVVRARADEAGELLFHKSDGTERTYRVPLGTRPLEWEIVISPR